MFGFLFIYVAWLRGEAANNSLRLAPEKRAQLFLQFASRGQEGWVTRLFLFNSHHYKRYIFKRNILPIYLYILIGFTPLAAHNNNF